MRRAIRLALWSGTLMCAASAAAAQPAAAPAGATVLETYGSWRMFHVLSPPQIAFDGGVKPAAYPQHWLAREGPMPPAGWTEANFDDSDWLRGPVRMGCQTPFVARVCFRGRFRLADPAKAGKLTLTADYQGGLIVYVNGREIRRSHVPAGARRLAEQAVPPALAEPYPMEAFVAADGVLLAPEGRPVMSGGRMISAPKPDEESLRRMALRKRTLAEAEVPADCLRKGLNVLAIEVVRAPYHKVVDEKKTQEARGPLYDLSWNTCELLGLRLAAARAEGLETAAAPADGARVWNSSLLRGDFERDSGDRCEPVGPVLITGVRNGTFSGKVVVGGAAAVTGLKASASELKGPGGTIPASEVSIRYGTPGSGEYGVSEFTYRPGALDPRAPRWAPTMGVLSESPPKAPQAVVPVWVTVRVPADAKPGLYEGALAIQADGLKPVSAPIRLEVLDWTLPDPERYRTWIELMESPDTLQLEYGVEPWSAKHFDLIARSMRFLREVGSGVLYVPLLCETNYGNAESMVRWIQKGEKDYAFDFSVMDQYLDAAARNMGQPKAVCFITWDVYLLPKDEGSRSANIINRVEREVKPAVSVLDPATKKVQTHRVPNYDDPAMLPVWKALFTELRAKMKARGLEGAMMIGMFSDGVPSKPEIAFWRQATGDLPWVSHAHHAAVGAGYNVSKIKGEEHKIGYMTSVFEVSFAEDPAKGRSYGWKNPVLHAQNVRLVSGMDPWPGTFWRGAGEINISGSQRGFGRLGADFWDAVKDKNGRRMGRVQQRYPQSYWGNLDLRCSLLAPGPEGALATARYENLREGVQECEARIFLEQALTDPASKARLGADLAGRAQALLDERTLAVERGLANFDVNCRSYSVPWNWIWQQGINGHAWFQSSGWRQRAAALYSLAAEAAKKLGAK